MIKLPFWLLQYNEGVRHTIKRHLLSCFHAVVDSFCPFASVFPESWWSVEEGQTFLFSISWAANSLNFRQISFLIQWLWVICGVTWASPHHWLYHEDQRYSRLLLCTCLPACPDLIISVGNLRIWFPKRSGWRIGAKKAKCHPLTWLYHLGHPESFNRLSKPQNQLVWPLLSSKSWWILASKS